MKIFVTGATGFIGGHVARKLRERGDDVVCLVRSPERARDLGAMGCELVQGDLSDRRAIADAAKGCDAAIHGAAIYKVGIPAGERPGMHAANVAGTENVLDGLIDAGVGRILYVSTVNVFGNTRGEIVDETYERDTSSGFLSTYDETKYRAHEIALDRIAKGAPIVIAQPGGVFGPGDHSELGNFIEQTRTGKLKMKLFPDLGLSFVHVEDVADGVLLALDRGAIGESYVLSSKIGTIGELVDRVAEIAGRKAPRLTMPGALVKLSAPLGPLIGPLLGFPPNIKEAVRVSDGTTYWASHEKAARELGYSPGDFETRLRETVAAAK